MALTYAQTLEEVTQQVIDTYKNNNQPIIPKYIEADILANEELTIECENQLRTRSARWPIPKKLTANQIAMIIEAFYPIARIDCAEGDGEESTTMLSMYIDSGDDEGLYSPNENYLKKLIYSYNSEAKSADIEGVFSRLTARAPMRRRCIDKDMIPLGNGIFNYRTKTLEPYSKDKIFLTKSRVNYNPNAQNVVIHNDIDNTDFDVESWMQELDDDPAIVNLLWQMCGASVRPLVSWNRAVWLYSTVGNNGKGTLCELMRNLCGTGSSTSISMQDFKTEFMLESLLRVTSVICDENPVGIYIDTCTAYKTAVTGDRMMINRKFQKPVTIKFKGLVVECINELPRCKDKSDSFYRRQVIIPFEKTFTGRERKYIKDDYLKRQDVLEYVLYRTLHMPDYYDFDIPDKCAAMLEEYKEYNDPVRQFKLEVMDECVWDILPITFLYPLYLEWTRRNGVSSPCGKQTFAKQLQVLTEGEWSYDGKPHKTKDMMSKPEPLIAEYDITAFMNPMYKSSYDINKKCTPPAKEQTRGFLRL